MSENLVKISKAFSKQARLYADRADIQSEVAYNLSELIASNYYVGEDVKVLDVGCGTGFMAESFQGVMSFMQLDISRDMCEIASKFGDSVQGDMNKLPFKDNSFDMVTSSMAFQWSDDLSKTFSESYRVLSEGGILAFTIPNNKSLVALKNSFSQLGKQNSINDFYDEEYVKSLLEFSKFSILEFHKNEIKVEFDNVISLLKSFKEIGANISKNGGENLTKSDLKFLQDTYPDNNDKKILTWDINYVVCKK